MKTSIFTLKKQALLLIACTAISCPAFSQITPEQYQKLYQQAQVEVLKQKTAIITLFDAQALTVEELETAKTELSAQIHHIKTNLTNCKNGSIAPALAPGCENIQNYLQLHGLKMLLAHIEQKIEAQSQPK
ncbi:MAG: hypothetical protein AB7F19_00650 [Candidatus Babeliales bacterium]